MGDSKRKLDSITDDGAAVEQASRGVGVEEQKRKKHKKEKKEKKGKKDKKVDKTAGGETTTTRAAAAEAEAEAEAEAGPVTEVKRDDKIENGESIQSTTATTSTAEESGEVKKSSKKAKKSKSSKSKKSSQEESAAATATTKTSNSADEETSSQRKPRFIVFVGNLPYGITHEQLATHFSKIRPSQIRLATDRQTGKSKGYAFVEFENYDRMKTCLKLYHHSVMDDGSGEAKRARKINCELSAGGGGKSEYRKQKIQYKNEKLAAQRVHTAQLAQITKKKKEKREKFEGKGGEGEEEEEKGQQEDDYSGVHPSRRNRVPGA